MNLSWEQIRELQIALNEKGFDVGEPDGRLGPRTNRALMEFQQRQGLQATGHIDQQTVEALGINAEGQQGSRSEPTTSGQSGRPMQQPRANPNPPANPSSSTQAFRGRNWFAANLSGDPAASGLYEPCSLYLKNQMRAFNFSP